MFDPPKTAVSCDTCDSTGWAKCSNGYAPCGACIERRQSYHLLVLGNGGSGGVGIGLDSKIKRWVKEAKS